MTQLLILNLIGTFVFGVSGGILAVRKQMDLFGVLVLSVVAALGGGMLRDVLLGHTPPATLNDWRYIAVAASAGLLVFADHGRVGRWQSLIVTFDAAGLGLFTVTGTVAALDAGLSSVASAVLGMLTGIGGGVLRDLLAGEVPFVLRKEIYALASLLGALIIIAVSRAHIAGTTTNMVAALATFVFRMVSVWRGWNIPRATVKEC
ncbi:MAG: trimeric intracellular cation channel family protein [Candidatus Acidiferrales bacterium]